MERNSFKIEKHKGNLRGTYERSKMARKTWVKVYLSQKQKKLLEKIAKSLQIGESEVLRQAFMEYAKDLNLIQEEVHE